MVLSVGASSKTWCLHIQTLSFHWMCILPLKIVMHFTSFLWKIRAACEGQRWSCLQTLRVRNGCKLWHYFLRSTASRMRSFTCLLRLSGVTIIASFVICKHDCYWHLPVCWCYFSCESIYALKFLKEKFTLGKTLSFYMQNLIFLAGFTALKTIVDTKDKKSWGDSSF